MFVMNDQIRLRLEKESIHLQEVKPIHVIFENRETKHAIAKWLMQSDTKCKDADRKFGYLLALMGLKTKCVWIAMQEHSFLCKTSDQEEMLSIQLWDGEEDDFARLIFRNDHTVKKYVYHPRQENEICFFPRYCMKTNEENGNHYHRAFSPYTAEMSVFNETDRLSLSIINKDSPTKTFQLPTESFLQEALLHLSFPLTIEEIYFKICSWIPDLKAYPHIDLKLSKKGVLTDAIALEYGKWIQFVKTEKEQTVSVKSNQSEMIQRLFEQIASEDTQVIEMDISKIKTIVQK